MPTPKQLWGAGLRRAEAELGSGHPSTLRLKKLVDGMREAPTRSAQELYFSGRPMESRKGQ